MFKYLFTIILLISGQAIAQNAPDAVVNATSDQGVTIENQNFNNLYQAQTQTQATVSSLLGSFINGILQPSSGGTGQNSSTWPIGDVVYMSAPGVWSHEPTSSVTGGHGIQLFTSSGTFTAPAGVTIVYLTMTSGGGGGGNSSGGSSGSGGGGGGSAGAYLFNYPYPVTPGNTYSITVGSGGSGGSNGNSSVFDALTLMGGNGGGNGSVTPHGSGATPPSTGNSASSSTGGSISLNMIVFGSGADGNNGGAGSGGSGGGGGGSAFGVGGNGNATAGGGSGGNGSNATGFCAGGGGASGGGGSGGGASGGSGSPGFVIVQY